MADPSWGSQIFSHYGYKPYWDESSRQTEAGRSRERTLKSGGGAF
jgi:hypothetical protein